MRHMKKNIVGLPHDKKSEIALSILKRLDPSEYSMMFVIVAGRFNSKYITDIARVALVNV
jgi:hypothetical protein